MSYGINLEEFHENFSNPPRRGLDVTRFHADHVRFETERDPIDKEIEREAELLQEAIPEHMKRMVIAQVKAHDLAHLTPAQLRDLIRAAWDTVKAEEIRAKRQAAASVETVAATAAENLDLQREFARQS